MAKRDQKVRNCCFSTDGFQSPKESRELLLADECVVREPSLYGCVEALHPLDLMQIQAMLEPHVALQGVSELQRLPMDGTEMEGRIFLYDVRLKHSE